ncbi:MAG: response regulator [bacterium]|nr:response regulator [bacterium]
MFLTIQTFPRSRFTRRLLLIFVVSAFVPVVAFGLYVYRQMVGHLQDQSFLRLRLQSEAVVLRTGDRLDHIAAAVAVTKDELAAAVAEHSEEGLRSRHLLDGRFDGLSIVPRSGPITTLKGQPILAALADRAGWAHLSEGKPLLTTFREPNGHAYIAVGRLLEPGAVEPAVLWGRIQEDFMWRLDADGSLPGGTLLCVLDRYGEVLVKSSAFPADIASRLHRNTPQRQTDVFSWVYQGTRYLAAQSQLALTDEYGAGSWTVLVCEPQEISLRPIAQFRRSFSLVTVLALLTVLLASVIQIRRSLVPLAQLRDGTRRMAERDFNVALTVSSGDEFEEVADGFNLMALRLGRQFQELSMIAAVSRAALEGGDEREISRPVLERLPRILACDRVSLRIDDGRFGEKGLFLQSDRRPGEESSDDLQMSNGPVDCDCFVDRSPLVCDFQLGEQQLGTLEVIPPQHMVYGSLEREQLNDVVSHLALALHQHGLVREVAREGEKLAKAIEHLPSGVLLVDTDGQVVLQNPIAGSFLPILQDETDGTPDGGLRRLGGRDLTELVAECGSGAFVQLAVDGEQPRYFLVGVARLGDDEQSEGLVVVIRDVTSEREAGERLRQHDRLAAVGRLAAGIAHDFNNILQGIMMSAELMYVDGELDGELGEAAQGIFKQGERGARLIRQILDFSRSSSSAERPIDLGDLCRETLLFLETSLPTDIDVETRLPQAALIAIADPDRMQQLLTNLMLNARDALAGSGTIRVGLAAVDENGEEAKSEIDGTVWAKLVVEDSGPGIGEGLSDQIFEPFFTTKEPGEGTGLGLAQVYGIASQHRGRVDIEESELGGARFVVCIPLAREGELEHAGGGAKPEHQGDGELVLVAQADPALLELTCSGLDKLGYLYVTARDGASARESLNREDEGEVSLVLADFVLPDMTGMELARRVGEECPQLPVVLMSGYPADSRRSIKDAQMVRGWLAKPFKLEELAAVVGEALRNDE